MSRWVGLVVVVLAISACAPVQSSDVGDPVPSNPPKPDLAGRILAFDHGAERSEGRVVEVRDGVAKAVVEGAIAADLSPDGRQLAYVRDNGALVRRDLATGAETAIATGAPASQDCLSWSPDGGRLAFLGAADGGLYATTVDGPAKWIDLPKTERYVESAEGYILPQADPGGAAVVLVSEITCGRWLDERRLVYDRVVDMPATVTRDAEETSQQVPADTTTVAVVEPWELVNSPERWRLEDRCGDYAMTFVDDGTKGERYVVTPVTVGDDHNPPLLDPDTVVFNPEGTAWAVADEETLFVFNLETGGSTFISSAGLVGKVLGWLPS